jgi:2-dehydro-3-deoxy-D-arabinonate dehydratase
MRFVRCVLPGRAEPSLGLIDDPDAVVRDLGLVSGDRSPLPWLRRLAAEGDEAMADLRRLARRAPGVATLSELAAAQALLPPVDCPEVWAAGVTYERSREARDREAQSGAGGPTPYDRAYAAARPELFFKATGARVQGHRGVVGLRADSHWQVPEPELALVLDEGGALLGYTLGNDMSSRDIEGENPLYLPQAKIYRCSCALGPAVLPADAHAPSSFPIVCEVVRRGQSVWKGETDTSTMRRRFTELISYLARHNWVPAGTVLLTGTGLVPPDDFTLEASDSIAITSPAIGTLENTAVWV